jgi:polysaccharide export outer membrane protein
MRGAATSIFALLLIATSGCGGAMRSYDKLPPPKAGAYATFRVGAPDILSVVVLPEPVIALPQVVVRPDGMISIDLIGDVPAGGRTVEEIAADIERRIARFKRDASVTVSLAQANSTAVTVFGEVNRPSSFPLTKDTRIAEAIGMVGGETMFARTGKIRIVRTSGGETAVFDVDLNAIRGGDLSTNILLASGDIVYVAPNMFARIGYAMNSLFLPFQPLFGMMRTFGFAAAL